MRFSTVMVVSDEADPFHLSAGSPVDRLEPRIR
jgi:hypothetical protein